jgi:hypothetical protein
LPASADMETEVEDMEGYEGGKGVLL